VRLLKADAIQQQLMVRMRVTAADGSAALPDSRAQFSVGFYDFPVIDNTRLPTGVCCATTLANFSPGRRRPRDGLFPRRVREP